jgi:photosystem II stability/assembly factor-like uncharacterized protein
MKNFCCLLVLVYSISVGVASAQKISNPVSPTPFQTRLQDFEKRQELKSNSFVKEIPFRSVGPSVMSGRVTDVDVNPADPKEFYVAYASGGLWFTKNNGQSFTPVFDNQPVMTIGDIAVDWKRGIVWVGTGENNSSRSSYSGTGIYVSYNRGSTWLYRGLGEMHHCGRIVLHPDNPDVLWVASMGHLYSPNSERGIYKTTDGGITWKHVLYLDDNTGAIDLVINPKQWDELYASMWHRERRAWNFTESGTSSGIYKSTDGGESWIRITSAANGFPDGNGTGRIGLDIYPPNPQIVYAVLDNQNRRAGKKEEKEGLTKDTFRLMTKEVFLQLNDSLLNKFLKDNGFEKEHTAEWVKSQVRKNVLKPSSLVEYMEDANAALFDTDVIGAEVYRSVNGGLTWNKMNSGFLDEVYNTYGYYFGEIRVSPQNDKRIIIGGVPVLLSEDAGKTFRSLDAPNMHVDYQAFWINPADQDHIIIGNDGGINITYDGGKTYFKANSPPVGQFYTVQYDMSTPYNVYGGLQDNGVWYGPSTYEASPAWHQTGHYPYRSLVGGDGMQVMVDLRDNNTVYTGYQFGYYFRINKTTGEMKSIRPKHKLGERPLRFNWQTPIWLSVHNADILYLGSNKFHRSMNKGETWVTLTGDLTKGGKKGNVPYGTLTAIHESPLRFGLIYAGTDDGLVHVSKDGGYTFTNISKGLPEHLWVSRIVASAHDTATVFVSLNGYRWDHFASYLFMSVDYGKTWQRIGLNLPAEPVNVVRDDPQNPNLLYAGTDHGVYVSLDKGKTFMAFSNGLADAPVHDLVIHPREKEIIIGTHGRSIYIASVNELQQLHDSIMNKDLYLFAPAEIKWNKNKGKIYSKWFQKPDKPVRFAYWSKTQEIRNFTIQTESGLVLNTLNDTAAAGISYVDYDLSVDSLTAGTYFKEWADKKALPADYTWKQQDDGRYYLMPGNYWLVSGREKTPFLIKENRP